MANTRSSNTFYIDTQYSGASDELAIKNLKVLYVIVTATAASAVLALSDSGTAKVNLRVATSGETSVFDFSNAPILFATSVRPTTLTNAIATVVIQETRA